jgi:Na+/proline symporter
MAVATTHAAEGVRGHELVLTGVIAGLAKVVIDTTMAPLVLTRPFAMLQATAAIILGPRAASPSARFEVPEAILALVVHFVLSILFATLLFLFLFRVRRFGRILTAGVGVAFGVALYLVDFHLFSVAFPWFKPLRGLLELTSHALFGLVVSLVFSALHPPPTLEDREPEPGARPPLVL